jgi:hypothetical protein
MLGNMEATGILYGAPSEKAFDTIEAVTTQIEDREKKLPENRITFAKKAARVVAAGGVFLTACTDPVKTPESPPPATVVAEVTTPPKIPEAQEVPIIETTPETAAENTGNEISTVATKLPEEQSVSHPPTPTEEPLNEQYPERSQNLEESRLLERVELLASYGRFPDESEIIVRRDATNIPPQYEGITVAPGSEESVNYRALPLELAETNDPGDRGVGAYKRVLGSININDERYKEKLSTGETWCNIAVWDASRALGVEIPHWDENGAEMSAADVYDWLVDAERGGVAGAGWQEIPEELVNVLTGMGVPVVAATREHVAFVYPPSADRSQIRLYNIGVAEEMGIMPIEDVFKGNPGKFFVPNVDIVIYEAQFP